MGFFGTLALICCIPALAVLAFYGFILCLVFTAKVLQFIFLGGGN